MGAAGPSWKTSEVRAPPPRLAWADGQDLMLCVDLEKSIPHCRAHLGRKGRESSRRAKILPELGGTPEPLRPQETPSLRSRREISSRMRRDLPFGGGEAAMCRKGDGETSDPSGSTAA